MGKYADNNPIETGLKKTMNPLKEKLVESLVTKVFLKLVR